MPLVTRKMRPTDAGAFLDVHRTAVRAIAAQAYPAPVIQA
jgi:hypothetical protein